MEDLRHELATRLLGNTRNRPPTLLELPPSQIVCLLLVMVDGRRILVNFVEDEFVFFIG